VQIAQSGGMVAIATPMDAELGRLAADLRGTVIYYGDADKRASAMKSGALAAEAPAAVTAERASVMNKMGRAETSGSDLVTMVRDGMTINEVRWEDLSPEISAMKPEERAKLLSKKVEERAAIQAKIDELAKKREAFLREALTKTENKDAFDTVVNGIIRDQAAKKGIRYWPAPGAETSSEQHDFAVGLIHDVNHIAGKRKRPPLRAARMIFYDREIQPVMTDTKPNKAWDLGGTRSQV